MNKNQVIGKHNPNKSQMRAVVITQPGDAQVLQLKYVDRPKPGLGEVQVQIYAAGLNQADIFQRQGKYPAPADSPQNIPGLEFAGVITELGASVQNLSIGDPVFGLVGGGAYAEYLVTNSRSVTILPQSLSFTEGAAIPEAFITAYDAMVSQGMLACGERVLINAVGSGVGIAALQIAKAIGATTIGTSRTVDKIEQAKKYGLDYGIATNNGQFAKKIIEKVGEVDVIVEMVGGNYIAEDILCAATKARIILVGNMGGNRADLDLAKVLSKRLQMVGTTLRRRPLEEKIMVTNIFRKHLIPLFEKKVLKPVVDRVFLLSEAAAAHTYLEMHKTFGKVILSVTDETIN